MNRDLLDVLADPETHEPLRVGEVREEQAGRVLEGTLVTPSGRTWQIVRGIPRFVPSTSYAANFGLQWNRFRREQLDSDQGSSLSQQRYESETGWTVEEVRGKWMLDAGCGAGRFAQVAARTGARLVALDISSAVDACAETVGRGQSVDVVQGDLARPPLKAAAFDFAYCLGVIQHTPDRVKSLQAVVSSLKPGGRYAFTIYPRKLWTKLHGKYWARHVTKRLPNDVLLGALERVMPLLFAVGERVFPLPGAGQLARFASPFAVYLDTERPGWSRDQRYRESLLDTFDMLAPAYDEPMTASEVRAALAALSVASIDFPRSAALNVVGRR